MAQIYDFYPAHIHALSELFSCPLDITFKLWKSMNMAAKAEYISMDSLQDKMDEIIQQKQAQGIHIRGGL